MKALSVPRLVVVCLAAIGALAPTNAAAQRKNPTVDRRDDQNARRAPTRDVRLRVGDCQDPKCLGVRLDDLGTTSGVYFAPVPRAEPRQPLRGALCNCNLTSCLERDVDRWQDANPASGEWGVVKLRDSAFVKSALRDRPPGVWAIRWDGLQVPFYSWDIFISRARIDPAFKPHCTP